MNSSLVSAAYRTITNINLLSNLYFRTDLSKFADEILSPFTRNRYLLFSTIFMYKKMERPKQTTYTKYKLSEEHRSMI